LSGSRTKAPGSAGGSLLEPDPKDEAWPSQQYLRQGVRANGWVLLNQVALGYELWRQFNGFPPVVAQSEPAQGKK